MSVRSLSKSGLVNFQRGNSLLAGYETNQFHHLETVRLGGPAAFVEFTNLGRYSDYQHLQIRYTEYYTQAGFSTTMQLNGDTGGNYNSHGVYGTGSAVTAGWQGPSATALLVNHFAIGHTTDTNVRTVGVVDILDSFDTTKNTTIRSFGGQVGSGANLVFLHSGLWRNTSAITSIRLATNGAPQFATDSRFSLYGIKARA